MIINNDLPPHVIPIFVCVKNILKSTLSRFQIHDRVLQNVVVRQDFDFRSVAPS